MKIVLIVVAIGIVAFYLYSRFKNNYDVLSSYDKDIHYGPFIIKVSASTGRNLDMDKGMVTYTNVAYSIFCNGQAVAFPGALQNNTGLPFLWAVYALKDAPEPTLIAGSQSLYLIYLKNGVPVVEPILEQGYDFASLQFLDGANGKPGPYSEVYMKNEIANLDQLDSLSGGRYLMVTEHAVLDVHTFKIWEMNKNNNAIENYSFPAPHGVLAFSPDQKSIVFHAQFQSWNTQTEDLPESEHALVVYNYKQDSGYAVKYDDTETRMTDIQDADYSWFTTYFEWKNESNSDRLHLRQLKKLPYWTGKYDPKDSYYTLYPVKPSMVPVFLEFVLAQMGWSKENILEDKTAEYTGHTINLGSGVIKLDIGYQEDDQKLSFSKYLYDNKTPENEALVKRIAEAFNKELQDGKHQEHFGRILSQTKRIMGAYDKEK